MISDKIQIRPRYNEVDQMGYVYHGNYAAYCHQARTEMLRKMGLNDKILEDRNIMLPVIVFNSRFRKAAHYDEILTIKTIVSEMPAVRFHFEFEIFNEKEELITTASSTVVFADSRTRLPKNIPGFIKEVLQPHFKNPEN